MIDVFFFKLFGKLKKKIVKIMRSWVKVRIKINIKKKAGLLAGFFCYLQYQYLKLKDGI